MTAIIHSRLRRNARLLGLGLGFAASVLVQSTAFAQIAPAEGPPAAPPASKNAKPQAPPLPPTPQERAKLLGDLLAHLATADSPEQAAKTAAAIETLWVVQDSDTIALLLDRALKAVTEKNPDLALQFLDAAVDMQPDYPEAWHRRAYVYYMMGDTERALGDLRRVLALEPNQFKALDGLAQILRTAGQKKAALKAYQLLLKIHPLSPGAADAARDLSREVEGQGI